MKKNVLIISLIFILPIVTYFTLSTIKSGAEPKTSSNTQCNAKIIKFSSAMCRDCKKLAEVMDEVYPKYQDKIELESISVEKSDKKTVNLIKKYKVTLVPALVYIYNGEVLKYTEGALTAQQLEKNMKELINGTLR